MEHISRGARDDRLRVVTVIGNRPQFVKAAAVSRALRAEHDEVLVHTGQHYDDELSTVFVDELGIPRPERELGLGGTNTEQTARMLAALGPLLAEERADAVLVYGDTNSTLAGGLAAAQARIPVAHVEAGMRSFDRRMPEELNRVLTDHLSDLLLAPERHGGGEPARARASPAPCASSGTSWSTSRTSSSRGRARTSRRCARRASSPASTSSRPPHRAGNVDDPARLGMLVALLRAVPGQVVLPLHPRTRARLQDAGLLDELAAEVALTPPLGPLAFTSLLVHARAVLTDSGGVQKEAYLAGVPCVTLRDTTEWVETVDTGVERARRPRRRRGAAGAGRASRRPPGPSSTATGARASASWPSSPRWLPDRRRSAARAPRSAPGRARRARRRSRGRPGTSGPRSSRYSAWSACRIAPATGSPSHGVNPSAASSASSYSGSAATGVAPRATSSSRSASAPLNAVSLTPPR